MVTDGTFPLTYAQEERLRRYMRGPRPAALPGAAHVHGPLDRAALDAGLRSLVRRHDALRARFRADAPLLQWIEAPEREVDGALRWETVSRAPSADDLEAHAAVPFDVSAGPLLRLHVFEGSEGSVLMLVVEHLVADVWSLRLLLRDLAVNYEAHLSHKEPAPRHASVTYQDYIEAERQRLSGDAVDRALAYWHEALEGIGPMPPIPTSLLARVPGRPGTVTAALPAAAFEAVARFAARLRVTPFNLALAAFAVAIRQATGISELGVVVPYANRTRAEHEELVAWMSTPVVIRVRAPAGTTLADVCRETQATALMAYRQVVPFALLKDRLRPSSDVGARPFIQFTMQYDVVPLSIGSARLTEARLPLGTAALGLSVVLHRSGQGVEITMLHGPECDREAIKHLCDRFVAMLRTCWSPAAPTLTT